MRGEHHAANAHLGYPKWDHPRMRGEHVAVGVVEPPLDGIIPACAGST